MKAPWNRWPTSWTTAMRCWSWRLEWGRPDCWTMRSSAGPRAAIHKWEMSDDLDDAPDDGGKDPPCHGDPGRSALRGIGHGGRRTAGCRRSEIGRASCREGG